MGINISRVILQPHARILLLNDPRLLDLGNRSAVERVAGQIEWGASRQAWQEILNHSRQEQRSPRSVRTEIMVEAVALALTRIHDAQRFRVKDEWVVGDDKKIVEIIPYNLTSTYFEIWLHQEARKAAEAVVLGKPYPATTDIFDILDGMQRAGAGAQSDLLYQVLYANAAPLDYDDEFVPDSLGPSDLDERHEAAQERLATISERLTPKERDLLSSLERGESRAARAERTGDKASAVRKQYQRFNEHIAEITEAQKRDAGRECERCESREQAAYREMRESKTRAQEAQRRGAWEEVHDHEEHAWNALHDGYMWRDRADSALADMSAYDRRNWIARRFSREEAWDVRDEPAFVYRSSWQDKRTVHEEMQSQYMQWSLRMRERSKLRDAATARDVARRARHAWDAAQGRDPGFEYRIEAVLSRAAVRGTEARRAYRLMEAIAEAHTAEQMRRKAISHGSNRDDRPGMPSDSAWPDRRFRQSVREAWEGAWQDAWWGDIGDDELLTVLGEEHERVRKLGERERVSQSLAS